MAEYGIGYLGTAHKVKGFDLLPDTIAALRDEPVQWLLFTSGQRHPDTWRRLREFPNDLVRIRGRLPDAGKAYAECDIVFVPSRRESFCRVAAEALSNEIPVVASDLEPLRDMLGPARVGLTFPVDDVQSATAALRTLIKRSQSCDVNLQ